MDGCLMIIVSRILLNFFVCFDENVLLTERSILCFSFSPVFVSGTLFSRGEGNGGGNKIETFLNIFILVFLIHQINPQLAEIFFI